MISQTSISSAPISIITVVQVKDVFFFINECRTIVINEEPRTVYVSEEPRTVIVKC